MASMIPSGATMTAQVSWVDDHGNPARVDGPTAWASSDNTLVTVTADTTDSTKASVVSLGPIGPVQIQATADADMGVGVKSITAILDANVIAGEASAGVITLS